MLFMPGDCVQCGNGCCLDSSKEAASGQESQGRIPKCKAAAAATRPAAPHPCSRQYSSQQALPTWMPAAETKEGGRGRERVSRLTGVKMGGEGMAVPPAPIAGVSPRRLFPSTIAAASGSSGSPQGGQFERGLHRCRPEAPKSPAQPPADLTRLAQCG